MQRINYPNKESWKEIIQRPYADNSAVIDTVKSVIGKVKKEGDAALYELTRKFDGVQLESLEVNAQEWEEARMQVGGALRSAIDLAYRNIEIFHKAQLSEPTIITTMPGVECWRRNVAIDKVGLYIPGGTAPLFSTVLMLGIPAKLAGCKEIILCTPANKEGRIHPAILYAASVAGITRVFKLGGAQAIAAMAYGTEAVPAVYKIFGPGNQYVTAAKQFVQMDGLAIDMPAGPSEVCVIADATAHADFVAADLLSQAEHGKDSQVLLITSSAPFADECATAVEKQLAELPRRDLAAAALGQSRIVVVAHLDEAVELANEYAAEHLIIACENSELIAGRITNAGSVFIGHYSPESVGDYASGTNHTLPTNGFARAYSGVSIDSFVRKITYQKLSMEGLEAIGTAVITMAEAEGLQAHARAVSIRLENKDFE